jgi:eukaryotic-like serine/threonine-protein kinase
MATVYLGRRAEEPHKGDLAAVKVMLSDLRKEKEFVEMFADEAKLLSRLSHPNISRTLEVGHADHVGYIAMELLLGRTLADTWDAAAEAGISFRFDLAAWIGGQVARALHYAHELKDEDGTSFDLIHRDVNPTNIFLSYDGTIKLFDFGLAKSTGRKARTRSGIVKGKVAYLSPEQLSQMPLDRRSDIFSLGTTLWEMTTLRRLFKRKTDAESLFAIRDAVVPDPRETVEGYPDALWEIVQKTLAHNRDNRYQTAGTLADDLQAFVKSQGVDDMRGFTGALLHRLFPGERQKQAGWVATMATSPVLIDGSTIAPPAPIGSMPTMRVEQSEPMDLVRKKRT